MVGLILQSLVLEDELSGTCERHTPNPGGETFHPLAFDVVEGVGGVTILDLLDLFISLQ